MIFKEFKYNKESGELVVDTSPINWKDGCNLTLKVHRGPDPPPPSAAAAAAVDLLSRSTRG